MTHAALIDFYSKANMKRCVAKKPSIVSLIFKKHKQKKKKKEEKANCVRNVFLT